MSKIEDRELLKLAAKAAMHVLSAEWNCAESGIFIGCGVDGDMQVVWNPFDDDGDRYRLIQALGLAVDFSECTVWKRLSDGSLVQFYWGEIPDYPQEVVNDEAHAIVRAAAEIGRAM